MSNHQALIDFRQELHRNPCVSGNEYETVQRIKRFLEESGIHNYVDVGNHGLVVPFEGSSPGPEIWVRGDTDALPIQEISNLAYRSINNGVAHMCGHDGHTTILADLALRLTKQGIQKGKVLLLFQPAEEIGEGAKSMLADEYLSKRSPDFVFALHNLPGYKKGSVVVKDDTFNCAVKSIAFRLIGKTAHAAEPENGINPAQAIARILDLANELNRPDLKDAEFLLFTTVYSQLGSKEYGISAGEGEVHFTIRSFSSPFLKERMSAFALTVNHIADEYHLKLETTIFQEFEACKNDDAAVDQVRKAANTLGLSIIERKSPMKWGEDFGLFTQKFPGAMFGVGSGEESAALHNPDYDFPDEIIYPAASVFEQIIRSQNG